jgi:hypothetical protein
MERNTHPSNASGELDNRVRTSPSEPDEPWNQPATTSLVLGIVAFVIQLVAWGLTFLEKIEHDAAFERWVRAGLGDPPQSSSDVAGGHDCIHRLLGRGYRRDRVRREGAEGRGGR